MKLSSTGRLTLKPAANGVSNKVTGTGTVALDGGLVIDLSAANATTGNAWTLVDVGTLAETFGTNFQVVDFTEQAPGSGVWTKTTSSTVIWTFTEATGQLTVATGTACDILTFDLPGNPGVIDQVAKTITLTVPASPGVTSLAPTYTLSPSATCSPASGTTRNFTSPQTYTVTAQNGTTQKTYSVTAQTYQASPYELWPYSGSLFILTTPDGANIATGSAETDFPLLVRFNSNNFPFAQAASDGRDIRFATAAGASLSYQIEQWDSVNGQLPCG